MDGAVFQNQFQRLSPDFRCIAPDLPGHGDNTSGDPTVEGSVEALRSLMETQEISDAILVGWSLGAAVAWQYIADHQAGGVAGMMSVDMSPKLVNEAGWSLGLRNKDTGACLATTARFRNRWAAHVPAIAAGMFADRNGPGDHLYDSAVEKITSCDPQAMITMWESLLAADLRTAIARMDVPLLVAHGRSSRVYAADTAGWLTDAAPDARCLEFGRSGHSPHLEEPDAFARAVAEFSREI
jgi:pimeloyl-[acyl-carrier protein] methyl ester esterase